MAGKFPRLELVQVGKIAQGPSRKSPPGLHQTNGCINPWWSSISITGVSLVNLECLLSTRIRNGVIRQPAAKLAQRGASSLPEDVMVEKTSHTQGSISEEQNHNG